MLTADQIRLIRQTWAICRGVNPAVLGERFYSKLFTEYPALRALFSDSLVEQYTKLVEMLNVLVVTLDRPSDMKAMLEQLGTRHRSYGVVKAEYYTSVGKVLMWTLKTTAGDRWSAEAEAAWLALYQIVASTMMGIKRNEVPFLR